MKNFWIIGGGKSGKKAARDLCKANPAENITVVEKKVLTCDQLSKLGFEVHCADGIQYIAQNLHSVDDPDWIVPAAPVHVAYEWIKIKLQVKYNLETLAVPPEINNVLPNPIAGKGGQIYVSNADFICPEHCSEPQDICTYTGTTRPRILYDFLGALRHDSFRPVVVRSRQLAPGVGGFRPLDLFAALAEIESEASPVLLSTACRCHAVMAAFKFSAKHDFCAKR